MEKDLLFTAIKQSDWRNISENGKIESELLESDTSVHAFTGQYAEKVINKKFADQDNILLIVLDPLRIQSPMKRIKSDGIEYVAIQGEISVDSIIDKIKLQKDQKGKYSVHIKHFD